MLSPRPVLIFSVFLTSLIQLTFAQIPRLSPSLARPFSVQLPIPSIKQPLTTYTDPDSNTQIAFYEIKISPFTHKFYPDLPGSGASLVGYDATEPGPTLLIPKGTETLVRMVNQNEVSSGGNNRPAALHLHGSYSAYLLVVTRLAVTN